MVVRFDRLSTLLYAYSFRSLILAWSSLSTKATSLIMLINAGILVSAIIMLTATVKLPFFLIILFTITYRFNKQHNQLLRP